MRPLGLQKTGTQMHDAGSLGSWGVCVQVVCVALAVPPFHQHFLFAFLSFLFHFRENLMHIHTRFHEPQAL
jgi:predicted CDP-diglyceride synthetase/phosphatidate cytidylyltransferase